MKVRLREDSTRRISSRHCNVHVAEGIESHRPTKLAPSGFMEPFSDALLKILATRHAMVDNILRTHLGPPFYSDTGFILYHGDCMKFLTKLAASEFETDLTITSPPYNIGKEYERPLPLEQYVDWCTAWISKIYDITRRNGAFWLNVGYLNVPGKGLCVPIPYLLWDKTSFFLLQEIIWKYGAGVSAKRRLSPRNEKWLFYVKDPADYVFNLDDIRDPNVKYPNQKKNGKYRCNPLGKNPSDVWEFPKVTTGSKRSSKERTDHPAQFPLAVVERVIKTSSNQGEIVLDPFAGSCSAGLTAYGLGRIFVGFEVKEDYCHLAANRFQEFKQERENAHRQRTLF